jgi:hypothetical protein
LILPCVFFCLELIFIFVVNISSQISA